MFALGALAGVFLLETLEADELQGRRAHPA
jgi:hypothetical protein